MGIQDFTELFNNLDTACKGYVTTEQIIDFHQSIYFAPVAVEHVNGAIQTVCGTPGIVGRSHFIDVLEELERRRSIEEQSYWDFQALDYNSTNRICLKDALLLFREFHQNRFSMYTWHKFLDSRAVPGADVYFDEIRFWLCGYPEGEPATLEQITKEEARLERIQGKHDLDGYNAYKVLQDDDNETQEYQDEAQYHIKRRMNKWKKQGLEAMLFDDGLEVEDLESHDASKDHVTLNDVMDALESKYELLREKLLLEMARLSSSIEGDQSEIYQELCKKERQLRRMGALDTEVDNLPGSRIPLPNTLLGMMGNVRTIDRRQKEEAERRIKDLEMQGGFKDDIGKIIMSEYRESVDGDSSCGAALLKINTRYQDEKEAILSIIKEKGGQIGVITMEASRLSRQHLLATEEAEFQPCALAVGLAERPQGYKSSRLTDWDRLRCETLAKLRLQAKKGRKQIKSPQNYCDLDQLEEMGVVDLQKKLVVELVERHRYEREAGIHMLQGRDSENSKAIAKSMTAGERNKLLKTLRNRHTNWKNSRSDNSQVLHGILQEGMGLYYENKKLELQDVLAKVSEDDANEAVLADLQQRQEGEFIMVLDDIAQKTKDDLMKLILATNKHRIEEHFDNLAFVVLGTIEISEDNKDYVKALEEKYDALRDRVLIMGLKDEMKGEWKRMTDKERKKEMRERRKQEKKLRGTGSAEELGELIGRKHKAKMLPTLRKLMGEERGEFEARFMKQKATGQTSDEKANGSFEPENVLADLIPRYDEELDVLVMWLNRPETKSLSTKQQRIKILQLKLEMCAAEMEEDFEVAAMFVGLLERVLASHHGRHATDNVRQRDLARRRTQLRSQRIQQNEAYEKRLITDPHPRHGDTTGWQMSYLREVLVRHEEERENLLHFLQDDSMEDLKEAAAMMTEQDSKSRLAELHAKRRRLNLSNEDDQEEHTSILEEAVAIRAVCKKRQILAETRREPSKDDIIINILKDLQEEQDKEIAGILENIVDLKEDELDDLRTGEKDKRANRSVPNVFIVLTQSESKTHEQELIKALQQKYDSVQTKLLTECLIFKYGEAAWTKMGDEKQNYVETITQTVNSFRREGNNVGLIEVLGGFHLDKTFISIIGVHRFCFLELVRKTEDDLVSEPAEEEQIMKNPLLNLWLRFESEKKNILQKLKGLEEEYMSEREQQICITRITRETLLCSRDDRFLVSATLVGVAERQMVDGKPRMVGDKAKYERLAKHRFTAAATKKTSNKDQVIRDQNLISQMNAVLEFLEFKHQCEQDQFKLLLEMFVDQKLHQEVMMMSQQQRKDQLSRLQSKRETVPPEKQKEHDGILSEGVDIKRELCRQRMSSDQKAEAVDRDIHETMMAELILAQNQEAERLLQDFMSKENEELQKMQLAQINDRKLNRRENVAYVVFSPEMFLEISTDVDLIEALEGKYDALRDKLLAEALIKQLGESEWQRLSDLERQKKMMELKLKERQLRREGKFDEISQILGDALENQETLKRLMGENKEEQQRKLRERLERKKKRLAQGMSEEECNEIERQEIEKEEEEERKNRKNILLELDHHYEKEKEELLKQIAQGDDRLSKEKARQLQLLKLKREERKARNEDRFDSAALVLGLAEENKKKQQEVTEEERQRQQRLARERIEAARRKRREGKTTPEEAINHQTEDRVELQESLTMAVDRRHRHERDLLIQLLDESSSGEIRQKAEAMSEEERQDKLYELKELRKHWRQSENRSTEEHMKILQEAACYLILSELHKHQEEGLTKTEEEVKVHILSDLQMWQDAESAMIMSNLDDKDVGTLQQMVKMQSMVEDEGLHDNVSHVLLDQSKGDKSEDREDELIQALEQKYDALKDKLIEAALKESMSEDEWNKLSDSEKQKRIVELKMKERKLRQEGNVEEAAAIFEKVLENDELLDQILGHEDEEDEDKKRDELIKHREDQGLPTDEETINGILEEQKKEHGKQRRINVLENLNLMLEDEKAKLLKALKNQHNRIDQERERQLAIARLQHERRKLAREEKFESAAIIISQAREREEKQKQSFKEERERMKALARERLEARKRKFQQKKEEVSEEERLRNEDDRQQLEDVVQPNAQDISAVQTSILDALDQRQTEERNVLMDVMQTARNSAAIVREAKKMSSQELKTELLKLENAEKNWKQTSMQATLHVDEGKMSKAEKGKMFKEVAQRRSDHQAILTEAMVYKLQLEEQSHRSQNPDMSDDERIDDLSVAMLADLQEKQTTENSTIQTLMHDMEEKDLLEVKRVQRIAKREGWYDGLTGMLFQLSGADLAEEEVSLEVLDKTMADIEEDMKKERDDLIAEATSENASEEELQQALKQLEHEQELKRKAVTADLEQQRKKLMEKVAARKRHMEEKESEEIRAAQLILLSESQDKKQKESKENERSQQNSELQKRLEARRLARKKAADQQEVKRSPTDEERFSGSGDSSRPSTRDSNPFASMKREKTALDVTVSDKEKQDTYTKLMREQTAVFQHKQESQRKQEEMLKRRLAERQSKKQAEVQSLLNLGERQKTNLLAAKQDEKDKQLERMKERIKRERSRSPGKKKQATIEEGDEDAS
ncbi:trichohyalin-like isoform X3 [Ostrea edulis]|uniref:trichohyalin-like isoform X2 n=1 Tax=Ostrea edulis TaxID=37623 RepID=UPI0024AF2411|nr:trichohyalin-like isoform X2 [Ostrea edulis]XP_055999876.1 trichohyalin-like isoform X3 [Ostrea edulis]